MSPTLTHPTRDSVRGLPSSIDAEQAVLGGVMLDPDAYLRICDWLMPEDFYRRDHQLIYTAIKELASADKPFDAVTLSEWFESQGKLDVVGNGAYLIELASTTPSAANVVAYAEIVKSKSTQRKLIQIGNDLSRKGYSPEGDDVSVIVSNVTRALSEISNVRRGSVKGAKEIGARWFEQLRARYDNEGEALGLLTPWTGLNRLTRGLQDGHLIIVAGRPSMGKSAWAVNMALSAALRGKRTIIYNLEMTDTSIYNRCIASLANVPLAWLQQPSQGEEEYWARVTQSARRINESGLLIDDTAGLSVQQIFARCRRERMRAPIDLVVIDHLHLMALPGKTRETVEIGNITAELRKLAKELDCPVVLLSQLNRSLESRDNKRPRMSDLRESGNIEQDADMIILLYRDDYYSEREGVRSPLDGYVEMTLAKQREGETGRAWGRNALAYGRIDDYEGPDPIVPQTVTSRRNGGGLE